MTLVELLARDTLSLLCSKAFIPEDVRRNLHLCY